MVPAMHIGNSLDFREENIKILHQFYICRFDFSISLYVAFVFAAREDLEDEDEDLGELFDDFFFRFCFFGIFGRSVGRMSLNNSDAGCCPICCSKSWEDHGEESTGLPIEDVKSGAALNSFIQLGAEPDWPSQPMCATCLTSVGYPISISLSFTTKI